MFCHYQNSPSSNILLKILPYVVILTIAYLTKIFFHSACRLLKGICLKNIMEICGWKWIVTDFNHKYHTQNSLPSKILEKLFLNN